MKKVLIVHAPFCTPAGPSYAAGYLSSFLKQNAHSQIKVQVLDLNLLWHQLKFPNYNSVPLDNHNYQQWAKSFLKESRAAYSENNRKVVKGGRPELLSELTNEIMKHNPDFVLFSVVYNSQVFFTKSLVANLKEHDVQTVIGGPSATKTIGADHHLSHEVAALELLLGKKVDHDALVVNRVIDYSDVRKLEYFAPGFVAPIKSSNTCYYQRCTFCTHHTGQKYQEYSLDDLKQTILNCNPDGVFLIDDMIHQKRLMNIAQAFQSLNKLPNWICQLRPTIDLTKETFEAMSAAGCKGVVFGVESASNRILDLMRKGTNIEDVQVVLSHAHSSGIAVSTYIMFGFPTETEEEFMQSISFLESNNKIIDLVSPAVFGLQEGAPILDELERYDIEKVNKKERTVLPTQISYNTKSGLSREQAKVLYRKLRGRIKQINNRPSYMNFFREHWLLSLLN